MFGIVLYIQSYHLWEHDRKVSSILFAFIATILISIINFSS